MKTYNLSILIKVDDPAKLIAAATAKAIADGDLTPEDAADIDVYDALRWLIDPGVSPPGCEILDSTCE